jgi:hypothetical protein
MDGHTPSFSMTPRPTRLPLMGGDAKCGYECHTRVAAKDYIFTAYPKR